MKSIPIKDKLVNSLLVIFIIIFISLSVGLNYLAPSVVLANQCEQHDFGSPGTQIYVYADGRTWNFTAQNDMTVKTIEVKSVLASSGTSDNTFHIQVKINDNTVASWSQVITSTQYQPYTHTTTVSTTLHISDTIAYHIYGGTISDPVGGITGVNYVKLCDEEDSGTIQVTTNRADASWNITGPATYSGTGNQTIVNAPEGDYTIAWDLVSGCIAPPQEMQTLGIGGSISFNGSYNCGPTTCAIATTSDSGASSLRQCMLAAVSGDTITFDPTVFQPGNPVTITLSSPLPEITQGNLTIDSTGAGVILDGSAQLVGSGFKIASNNNTIKNLQILNFPEDGIEISHSASYNTIASNTISSNSGSGVFIGGSNNSIIGNMIGTNASGTVAMGNGGSGISIHGGQSNTIGGKTPTQRNVISGNPGDAIDINGGTQNLVLGNYIGTDISGTIAIPNRSGIGICCGASHNIIGGDTSGARNLISGNNDNAVSIFERGSDYNVVSGNYIGTDVSGTYAISNSGHGVFIWNGAQYNRIGGTTPGERNVISGNFGPEYTTGVWITGTGTDYNIVIGNYVGTDANGIAAIGNGSAGISVADDASHNTIGGSTPEERNLISGNNGYGIQIQSKASHNTFSGNYIGTDVSGTSALPNKAYGVQIGHGSNNNIIGGLNTTPVGACSGECNLVSGNALEGLTLEDSGTEFNVVSGNYIGTDVNGATAIPNDGDGVCIFNEASNNTIGGDTPAERNLISANKSYGVCIGGGNSNTISGNYIGTDVSGNNAFGNTNDGVRIWGNASYNTIGGDMTGEGNIIAFNGMHGVYVEGSLPVYNTFRRNRIHNNTWQGIALDVNANSGILPPTLTSVGYKSVQGRTSPGDIVEIFSDAENEGRYFHGSTIADAMGHFAFTQTGPFTGANITATATDSDGNTSEFSAPVSTNTIYVYLSAILKNTGPPTSPSAPLLDPISNPDGDGNYTVSWSAVNGATNYTLEEDDNASFSNPATVYSGASTSHSVSGKAAGTYYYRVQASNTSGSSGWSNTKSVVVNVSLTCEQHDFGSPGIQVFVYADGRTWNFTANNNMSVQTVDVTSVLASYSTGRTFHIQVKINGNTIASWDQYVNSTLYQPYYHSADVSLNLNAGDTITYHIYGGTMSSPAGGITGVNYVKLCGE